MTAVKAIFGLLLGALHGLIVGLVIGLVTFIVVGLAMWNSNTGGLVAEVVWVLCIVGGGVRGCLRPIMEELDLRKAAHAIVAARQQAEAEQRKALKAHLLSLLSRSRNDYSGLPLL